MPGRAVLAGLFVFANLAIAQLETPSNTTRCIDGVLVAGAPDWLTASERGRRCAISGRVLDEDGDAVQNVMVRAETASPDEPPPPFESSSAYTDDRGEFSLGVPPGNYYVVANSLGGLDDQPEIHTDGSSGAPYERSYYPNASDKASAELVTAGSNSGALVIRLARRRMGPLPPSPPADGKVASVAGVVFNEVSGAPLARVHISLRSFDDNGVLRSYGAMTTPDGKFSITGVPEGGYGIEARRVGFASPHLAGTSVKLRAGEGKYDLKLPLTPTGAIVGRVLDADGEPVDHAAMFVRSKIGTAGSQADGKGRFRIGG